MNTCGLSYITIQTHLKYVRDTGNSFGSTGRFTDILFFCQERKLTISLQKCIYCDTISNNQINKESTAGCNKMYTALTEQEHDRCPLSEVTLHMAAGNHLLRPYRGPQFPNGNSKRKIKRFHAAPNHATYSTQSTEQFNYAL
jgi:hypothetical protein